MSKTTIIIANRNNEKFLKECIESCLAQTVPVTIAVCDDASTDKSTEILKYYKNKNLIDFIWNTVQIGPSASRNKLISRHLDSDYFAILDSDDMMMPNKIERALEYLIHPTVGMVYADYYHLYNDGVLLPEFKQSYSRLKLLQNSIVHSGFVARKDCILTNRISDNQFYDESFIVCEDWELTLRLSRTHTAIHIGEMLTKVRIHGNNSSNYIESFVWQETWAKLGERINSGYYN